VRRKLLGLLATIGVVASSAVLLAGSPADAQRVANPGSGQLRFDSGTLQIRNEVFEAGSSEDQVIANINVGGDGNFTVSSLQFPPIPPIDGPLGDINVTIALLSGSGHVNPLTGLSNLQLSLRINIDGNGVGGDCKVSPINLNASSTNSGGVAYNPANGRVTLADHTFEVPGASGCSTFPINVNDEINSQLGLPSPSGQNHAVFSGFFTPIRSRAIVPSFTATPSSGPAPLNVAFDASASFHSRPVQSYQWDFDGNGSFDTTTAGPTTSTVYATPGTRTVRLRVTDVDGDFADTTRTVNVSPPAPDLVLTKSGVPNLVTDFTGDYTLQVANEGGAPTTGITTVVDTLPAGLAYQGFSGTGWDCTAVLQVVTCTTAEVAGPFGGTLAPLAITVLADGTNIGTVTNTATVATPGEVITGNNTGTADTAIIQAGIDLDIDKVHDEDEGLFAGETATYTISVANSGTLPATDTVVVTDELPPGTTLQGASGGFDWVCTYAPGPHTVTCFSQEDIDPGESLHDITIVVELTSVSSPLSNTASVTVTGESNPANDSATDTGEVLGLAIDYEILKTHVGDLVVGEPTTYGIGVQNVGTQDGTGPVTVTDELPAGLSYEGATGDGWTCEAAGQTVTCTHPGEVESGDVLPGISLQVVADASAVPSVTNTATVSGAGDANTANDASSDTGTVRLPEPDLALSKSHEGNFTTGSDGTYTLSVRNLAPERADGPTVVTDSLPAGVTYVSAGGTGWTCDAGALPQVSCTYADAIPGLTTAPPISLVVHAPDGAPEVVVNGATVANAGDDNPANDSAFDPTRIDRRQPAATALEADAIVLKVQIGSLTIMNAPYAVLTSGGVPVPGKTVTFRVLNQQQVICTAVTDASGVASCKGDLLTYLTTLTSLRYTADFTGDLDFQPAHDEAAILHLLGLKLL
jgi:uncharacterized repeat protein (TIGR01451 family)